tara:strand:- start:709 stop:1638 length:930 start_codon:yes stop_codon:yes gene_type:complete
MPFLGKLPGVAPLELLDGSVTSQKIADLAIAAVDIADDAVTYSKIQNVSATDRLLGRDTAGAGIIEEITPSAIRTMINVEDGANNYTHPSNHSISFIDGLQPALNLKADDTAISNIDNTSDANKPVSTATLTALNAKTDSTRVLTDVPSGAVFTDTVYTHPNHSGEVTSTADGATVIASNVVDEDNLKISNAGTNGQYLQKQSGNVGGLTWETVQGTYNAWEIKTAHYTAISGDQIACNHASIPITITLPASPSTGETVVIHNVGAALVTVAKNGAFQRINSLLEDGTLGTNASTQLVFVNQLIGWKEI